MLHKFPEYDLEGAHHKKAAPAAPPAAECDASLCSTAGQLSAVSSRLPAHSCPPLASLRRPHAAALPLAGPYSSPVHHLIAGKRLFLERMEDFVERFSVFLTRARLSEDPVAKDMLRNLNMQQLEANINLDMMVQG